MDYWGLAPLVNQQPFPKKGETLPKNFMVYGLFYIFEPQKIEEDEKNGHYRLWLIR